MEDFRWVGPRAFLKILVYITLFSQAGVLVVVMVESLLPYLDVVFHHFFYSVLEPYLSLIWRKLFNWICVYITLTTVVVILIKHRVETHGETRPRNEVFRPTQFYFLFDLKLCADHVSNLCNEIIALNGLASDEIDHLLSDSFHTKRAKLITLLRMLNRKENAKDVLMEACRHLALKEGNSWFEYLLDKLKKNDHHPNETDATEEAPHDQSDDLALEEFTDTDIKFEKLHESSFSNKSGIERTYEMLNNFFILSNGSLQASVVASNQIKLPFESELVSALWLVTVSGGTMVIMGISHSMKISARHMSHVFMVTAKLDGTKVLRLTYNKSALFSCRNEHGTLQLPVAEEDCTYVVGIVKRPDPKPQPGVLGYFRSSRPICQYNYLVVYNLCRQSKQFNYMHWRVHVLSFKNICGFADNLVAAKFPGVLVDTTSKECLDVRSGPLSVASVKPKGRKWKIFQPTVAEESLFNVDYHRFTFDIDWTGEKIMPDDFHCTVKWKGTKKISKIYMSPKELNDSLVSALGLVCCKPPEKGFPLIPRISLAAKHVLFDYAVPLADSWCRMKSSPFMNL